MPEMSSPPSESDDCVKAVASAIMEDHKNLDIILDAADDVDNCVSQLIHNMSLQQQLCSKIIAISQRKAL